MSTRRLLAIFSLLVVLGPLGLVGALSLLGPPRAHAEEPLPHSRTEEPAGNPSLKGMQPLMVCCTKRDPPTQQEWASLSQGNQHLSLLEGIADLNSKTISFNDTRYYTANATEGTLASYGKMSAEKRYDRYGQIEGIEFSIDQNTWKEKYALNAAALLKLTGSRFLEYAGVGLESAVDKNCQIQITFLGTNVPKDKLIHRLNSDVEALEYFDALQQKAANYQHDNLRIVHTAPPAPKIVLANVVMLTGEFSSALNADADASLHSALLPDGLELKLTTSSGTEMTLLSPVVRCYRSYSIEFKTDATGNLLREPRLDSDGATHSVPQVFDLTPDT